MRAPNLIHRLKWTAKRSLTRAWYGSGCWLLWKAVALRKRAVVLTYHRVLSSDQVQDTWSHPGIIVTRETFDRHMRLLRRWFNVLSLPEFVEHMETGKSFESGSCLVTFDDAWADTYTEAYPILKRYEIPAVVFLPVRYTGSDDVFWQEELGALLFAAWRRAASDPTFRERLGRALASLGMEQVLDIPPPEARQAIIEVLRERKAVTAAAADSTLATLRDLLGGPNRRPCTIDAFMTWEQVEEMSAHRVAFGAHSVTHRLMTTLSDDEVEREVMQSRDEVARRLGRAVAAFSYPNGDWNPAVAAAVRRGGFRVAFSTDPGPVVAGEQPFAVRRVNIHDDATNTAPMFLARVLGVL